MLGRIFGRSKHEPDEAVCADCGRTLLAGEWTQKVVDADGNETLICSLCGQARPDADGEPLAVTTGSPSASRLKESRGDSDAFWKALKEKDAEIERLEAQLARVEAEKQELAGRLALAGELAGEPAHSEPADEPAAAHEPAAVDEPVAQPAVTTPAFAGSGEPASATWGETPAEMAAALAEFEGGPPAPEPARPVPSFDEPFVEAEPEGEAAPAGPETTGEMPAVAVPAGEEPAVEESATEEPAVEPAAVEGAAEVPEAMELAAEVPAIAFEDTQPIAVVDDEDEEAEEAGETTASHEVAADAAAEAGEAGDAAAGHELPGEAEAVEPVVAAPSAAEVEAAAASLTLLQRGVDLLNVSSVPRKISETNEQLGLPQVHVGFDGQTVAATFLWTMGWYRYHVDIETSDVKLADRGYDQRTDLQPNASVRADGTVQLAAAQISRAAAQRPAAGQAAPAPEGEPAGGPEPPSVAAQKPPEILSKSLLGQRSDDEPASWEGTEAREFNWDR